MTRSKYKTLVTAVTLALFSSLPISLSAQQLGILAGGTFSQLHGLDNVSAQNRTGTTFGASLLLPFGHTWSLQPQVLFSNKGSRFDSGVGGEKNIRLDYVDIPLLLRYDLAGGSLVSPHLYAGPSAGYRVGCNVKVSGSGIPNTSSDCNRTNFDPETFDWGAIVGGGIDLSIGGVGVTGGARYGIGLANINKDHSSSLSQRVHNGTLTVYAGILLGHR